MENTPQSSDSDVVLDPSRFMLESTPLGYTRKRKAPYYEDYHARKLTDLIESPSFPQFSSTLNDSLVNNLEQINLGSFSKNSINDSENYKENQSSLYFDTVSKSNEKSLKHRSAPNTPEKQVITSNNLTKARTSSFFKNYSQKNLQSPSVKERNCLLYAPLPKLKPVKKCASPQKFKLAKTCRPKGPALLAKIVFNPIIMDCIFECLSNGDLYRLSLVSDSFYYALSENLRAFQRYNEFRVSYRTSKENYRITPPNSPERDEEIEGSPSSKKFMSFIKAGKELNKNQSLTKCENCGKPSIVQNSVAQCINVNSCGLIICLKCRSSSYKPSEFKDKCSNARLANVSLKSRNRLGDLSNSMGTSDYSSFLSSSSLNLSQPTRYDSSGFFSECEASTPNRSVKRNLSTYFTLSCESKPKALSSNNTRIVQQPSQTKRRSSLVPVIKDEVQRKQIEVIEPPSPPKVMSYSACSKQSKRNLKRLTR